MALINSKLPASTVGSLRDRARANAVVETIECLMSDKNMSHLIEELRACINEAIPLRRSSKHMNGRDLGRLEPTASLKYRKVA